MDDKKLLLCDFKPETMMNTPQAPLVMSGRRVIDIHTHFGPLVLGPDYASSFNTTEVVAALREYGVVAVGNPEVVWGEALNQLQDTIAGQEGFVLTLPSLDMLRFEEPGFDSYVRDTLTDYQLRGFHGIKLWKNLTLYERDSQGQRINLNDSRLACVFDIAGELGLFVLIHIADPVAFFRPMDASNEYYECLVDKPDWQFYGKGVANFEEHMAMQEALLARHPSTTFVIAHVGSCAEDLGYVGKLMDRHPNLYIDLAARINELGRQPYTARQFFIRHADRILFGTDFIADQDPAELYPYYFRFLETFDEYFDYGPPGTQNSMGRWKIYGIGLPEDVLHKVYYGNAARLLGMQP